MAGGNSINATDPIARSQITENAGKIEYLEKKVEYLEERLESTLNEVSKLSSRVVALEDKNRSWD